MFFVRVLACATVHRYSVVIRLRCYISLIFFVLFSPSLDFVRGWLGKVTFTTFNVSLERRVHCVVCTLCSSFSPSHKSIFYVVSDDFCSRCKRLRAFFARISFLLFSRAKHMQTTIKLYKPMQNDHTIFSF